MNSISKHDSEGKSKVICSRIQAEKDILQHMIDSAKNIHLVYLDTNFNFVKVNQAYAQTCGYKPEEMVGKNHFALYPHKENEAIFRKVRDSGDATHFHDKPFVFPDQRERGITYWDWTLEPIKETSGKVRGLVFSLVETTERKKAEKACREAEERLSLAKDAADLGVHEYDVSSGRVIWDDRIRELWGVDPDEPTTYDTFMAGVHPDDRQRLQKLVDEALDPKSGGKYLSEFRSINKRNGETRWIKATGKVFFENGKAIRLVGTAEDITESKQAEQALRESEKRYHQLFSNMTEGFFLGKIILDKQGLPADYVFLDANQGFEKQSGLRREDFIGKTVKQALPGIEESWIVTYGRVALTQKPERFKDYNQNTKRWYEVSAYCPVKGQFAAIFTDITDRKKTDEILFKQAALIDLSPEGVIIKDFDDTVTFWSEGAEKLYGWTKEEAIGRKVIDLLRPVYSDDSSAKEVFERLKAVGKWAGELVHHAKDGHEVVVMSNWLAMASNIGGMEILESNADISELKKLQLELQDYNKNLETLVEERTKELRDKERMAAIGQIAGMVGHDIRNPIQAMVSDIYLLKEELSSVPGCNTNEGVTESLGSLEQNLNYINKIVADLQDYAKPVAPEYSKINFSDLLVQIFASIAIPSSIKVSFNVIDLEALTTDQTLIRRVISNLVTNAAQAMPDGGSLEVDARRVGSKTVITVSDTGGGIPDEVKPKLFTPMMTTKAKGQGFGLAVCKRLVEAMGGKISFESEKDKGTKFIVELPNTVRR